MIGLSRTGTNSLSSALQEYSLSGAHWNGPNGKPILDWEEIEQFQFVSDTPVSFIFETLYYAYPDAYFIYTTRDVDSWVKSMENHFKWANGFEGFQDLAFKKKSTPNKLINLPLWTIIHRNLYANANNWEDAYNQFDRRVKKFFSAKADSNLLMLDVGLPDEEKWTRLSEFLGTEFTPIKPFPRKNIKLQKFESEKKTIKRLLEGSVVDFKSIMTETTVIPITEYIVTTIEKPSDLVLPEYNDSNLHYAIARTNGINKNIDLLQINDAYISFDFTKRHSFKFYIFNEKEELLDRVSHGDSPFLLHEKVPVNKKIGFLEDKFSNFNVCHLLTDKLSRVKQLQKAFLPEEYILFHKNDYIEQVKHLIGLKTLDIEQKGYVTLKVSQLFLSSASSYTFIHPAQNLDANFKELKAELLLATANEPKVNYPKRFFIDRSGSNARNIVNKTDFYDLLSSFGIESIVLEDYPLTEQIQIFKNAELVVAVHGAGLTNILFCRPDTKIIEILPPLCATPAFFKIAIANDLQYRYFIAKDEEISDPVDYATWEHSPAKYNRRNVIIDVEEFGNLLHQVNTTNFLYET